MAFSGASALQRVVDDVVAGTPDVMWSIAVRDGARGDVLAEHDPAATLPTASVGKLFLLAEAARRIEVDPGYAAAVLSRDTGSGVAEAGLWQYLDVPAFSVGDAARLVGSVSDNLATNVLLADVGLDAVMTLTHELGMKRSALLDRVRVARGPNDPAHLSVGSADELSEVMWRLAHGTVVTPATSAQVRAWLVTNADTSMVAAPFDLDPLAHAQPDRGVSLFHKTGSDSGVRADVGFVQRGERGVAYAVIGKWSSEASDLRADVLDGMRRVGAGLNDVLS
jgi:beta-lactamase class A